MRKIPTLFERDFDQRGAPITREYHPDALWVPAGEGIPTRKYDGTAAMVQETGGVKMLWKRYQLRPGKTAPPHFIPLDYDEETGKTVGWVPVSPDDPDDRYFREALAEYPLDTLRPGTYELIGPKVQGNPELTELHELVSHDDAERYIDVPTDYDGLREWLRGRDIEGLVWHHPDGRMAKIKCKDFGLDRALVSAALRGEQ